MLDVKIEYPRLLDVPYRKARRGEQIEFAGAEQLLAHSREPCAARFLARANFIKVAIEIEREIEPMMKERGGEPEDERDQWRGDADRRALLHVVQRRAADDVLFPQSDRDSDGNHRQPDAGDDPLRARDAAPAGRRPEPDHAGAGLQVPDRDRVLGDEQLRHPRYRVEAEGRLPLQHVQDGEERD